MKRVFVLLIALLIAFALVGCNVAPNAPGVTPYAPNGVNYNNGYGGTGNYYNDGNNGTRDFNNNRGMTGVNDNNRGAAGKRTIPGGNVPYGNRTGTYKNGSSAVRSGVNASDKYILPGAGTRP